MVLAVLLAQALGRVPPLAVGISLQVEDTSARAFLRQELTAQLSGLELLWSCGQARACVEVVAVPIAVGKEQTGWAVAARAWRKLSASAQWPIPPVPQKAENKPLVEIIEDTTAGGELACAPCEEEREQLQRRLGELVSFAAERPEEVGGLGLWVGPNQLTFLRHVAAEIASRFVRQTLLGGAP